MFCACFPRHAIIVSVIVFIIMRRIVVCAIGWDKPVFCSCIPGAVNITFLWRQALVSFTCHSCRLFTLVPVCASLWLWSRSTIERYLATVMASSNVPHWFEVGVVSIIADSSKTQAYCTDHFSARVIIKNYRGHPPNVRKPNSGLWIRDEHNYIHAW